MWKCWFSGENSSVLGRNLSSVEKNGFGGVAVILFLAGFFNQTRYEVPERIATRRSLREIEGSRSVSRSSCETVAQGGFT